MSNVIFSPKFRITFLLPSLATLLSILKLTKKILEVLSGVTSLLNGAKLTSYWTMVF